jgi:hypothetical protein
MLEVVKEQTVWALIFWQRLVTCKSFIFLNEVWKNGSDE